MWRSKIPVLSVQQSLRIVAYSKVWSIDTYRRYHSPYSNSLRDINGQKKFFNTFIFGQYLCEQPQRDVDYP